LDSPAACALANSSLQLLKFAPCGGSSPWTLLKEVFGGRAEADERKQA